MLELDLIIQPHRQILSCHAAHYLAVEVSARWQEAREHVVSVQARYEGSGIGLARSHQRQQGHGRLAHEVEFHAPAAARSPSR